MKGQFADWDGRILMDPESPGTAEILINIELESLTMGDQAQRDTALGEGFLGAKGQPRAVYRSTEVKRLGNGDYAARGTLSLNGTTRPQALVFRLAGSGQTRKVTGSARLMREDFGVGVKDIGLSIDPAVDVSFEFEAMRQAAGRGAGN